MTDTTMRDKISDMMWDGIYSHRSEVAGIEDTLDAILAALPDLAAPQWQPIETAPKDGLAVLLWWPHWWHEPHPGHWKDYQWHSEKALSPCHQGDPNGPTHWMPLPDAPTGGTT